MQAKTKTLWTFAITSVALFMVVLDNLVVSTALPVIRTDLDATIEQLEWTVNAYTLTFAVFLLTGAALGDRFGRRRMFIIGLVLFTSASAAAALAPSMGALIAARAAQGIGGAIVMPLTLTILSAAFPSEKRGMALGAWSGIAGLAVAAGPLVGGAVVDGIAWQWIFWLNVPIGLAVIPLARMLDESHGPDKALDLPGLALASGGLLGLVWGLVHGNSDGWSSPQIVASLAAGVVLLARLRRLGGAGEGADAAAALLREPGVLGRERRVARDVLRHVRVDLPALAVLPDRAGLLALRGRAAGAAVDGDADGRRADRRCALRPDRRPALPRRRARAAGDRTWLDRGRLRGRRRLLVARRAVHPLGDRHGHVLRARGERRPQRGRPARRGQGLRRVERDPRGRRCLRGRGARVDLRPRRWLRDAGDLHRGPRRGDLGRRRSRRRRRADRAPRPRQAAGRRAGRERSRRPRASVQDVSWGQSLGHVRSGAAAAPRR